MCISGLMAKLFGNGKTDEKPGEANILTDEQARNIKAKARRLLDVSYNPMPSTHPVYDLVNAFTRSIQSAYITASVLSENMQMSRNGLPDPYRTVAYTFGEGDLLRQIIPDSCTIYCGGDFPANHGINLEQGTLTAARPSTIPNKPTVMTKYPILGAYPIRPYADPVVAWPWNGNSLLNALTGPAGNNNLPAKITPATLLLPFGVTVMTDLNHATTACILKGVGSVIPDTVHDILNTTTIFDHVEYDEDGYHWDKGKPYALASDRRLAALYVIGQEIAKTNGATHPVLFHGIQVN